MSSVTLHEGDCRESLRRLIDQGVRVHSVVTDPPYGLTSVTKRFGKDGSAPAKFGSDGAFSRASAGFMGKAWDGTGIERDPEFWRLIYDILLPGGFVFAFSGARTGHWQACAMEMAGFIMHPMHGWLYGSGMPKAHNPCPGIDKAMGVESEVVGTRDPRALYDGIERRSAAINTNWRAAEDRADTRDLSKQKVLRPVSPEAQQWDGWRYGTQTQKPALEPVYLGQKPFSEKNGIANLLKHGVGAFNVDDCRVAWDGDPPEIGTPGWGGPQKKSTAAPGQDGNTVDRAPPSALGRWPANLLHDDSEAVRAIFPDSKGQQGAIVGTEPSRTGDENTHCYGKYGARPPTPVRGDTGSAARFFNSFPTTEEDYRWAVEAGLIDDVDDLVPAIYHAKATKKDRAGSKHPTVKAVGLIEHFIKHITPPGGTVLDPFAGSGTTAEAARRLGMNAIIMEAEPDYIAFLRQRFNLNAPARPQIDPLLAELL